MIAGADSPERPRRRDLPALVVGALLWAALGAGVAGRAAEAPAGLAAAALAPRSGPRGPTLFRLMPPEETGVVTENPYDDPKMWGDHYQEFALGSIGTGVAVGDYDGDGRPDLFVVSKTGRFWLYRNLGHWNFEDVTARAGLGAAPAGWTDRIKGWVGLGGGGTASPGAWVQGATFVDVNNDGRLDLYICRLGAANLLYISQGDGTFREEAAARGLAVADACGMGAFCDYDRDGWLDVFIQTNMLDATGHPRGEPGYLFHNNGDGTFTDVTTRAGIAGECLSHSDTWWDYDGDGWPDLYVGNDFNAPDRLYHNNRDGTFTDVIDRVAPHTAYYAMSADEGDLTNDGRLDLIVSEMAATTHEKDQRGMASSRAQAQREPADPAVAPQYMRNALLLNTGTGRCLEAAHLAGLAATDWTWSVRFEDLDDDGRLDLFVTNGMTREYHNADLLARIMALETPGGSRALMRTSPALVERHLAYRNLGDLRFEEVGRAWGLGQAGVSFGSAFGDFDGDGDLDLVHANYEAGVTLLRNDEDRGHRLLVGLRGVRSNRYGVGAVVRVESALGVQVRPLVLARGYLSSSEPVVHFGLGADTVVRRLTVAWPSGQEQEFLDLPVDRRVTVTEPSGPARLEAPPPPPPGRFAEVGAAVGLALLAAEGQRQEARPQPLLPTRFGRRGPALAVGDLAGTGAEDLVLGGTSAGPARLLLKGAGGYQAREFGASGAVDDGPVLVFAATGAGRADLLVTRAGTALPEGAPEYQPVLYLNDGHGGFAPAPAGALPEFPVSVGAVAAADFEHSGRLGVFLGGRVRPGSYPLAPRSALWANRGGRFADVTDQLAPGLRAVGMVSSALWSDVDGDGWPDLLLALEWGPVRCFHNEQGKGFTDWTEKLGLAAAGTGWWTALASADFNGDGRPDYVAGNVGLNTQYHASPAEPALLFVGDFAGTGGTQLLEACYEQGKLYPWRIRKELGAQIPSILKRYPQNDAYARATLEEIVGADRLGAAQRFAATQLQSGVFLSQPDGRYRFEPLPRLFQIAPVQGVVAGDFDGDGKADLYAVQNSFAPIPVVGRFDGGLSQLLRGDGQGRFAVVPPLESGLVVPGDAKALVVVDLDGDGWPDFVLTRNRSTTLAYRNRPIPGRHFLRVSLRGAPGNPTSVGARVTLELADGTSQTAEVAAGSGYYSQSGPACFFGWPDATPPRRLRVTWPDGAGTARVLAAPLPAAMTVSR